MRHRHGTLLMRLRRHRPSGWVAILLLLFQVVLSTDHLGASAARVFAPEGSDDAFGLLEMCHGDGTLLTLVDEEAGTPRPASAPPCILCSVAALAGNGVASAPPVLAPPVLAFFAEVSTIAPDAVVVRSPLRYGTGRGPPLPVHV
ncbi:MAG: hypothetical protein OEL76_13795 [Siculibacillus sp.]|nr:hypothetical protein [Siculibacillus sp.]